MNTEWNASHQECHEEHGESSLSLFCENANYEMLGKKKERNTGPGWDLPITSKKGIQCYTNFHLAVFIAASCLQLCGKAKTVPLFHRTSKGWL